MVAGKAVHVGLSLKLKRGIEVVEYRVRGRKFRWVGSARGSFTIHAACNMVDWYESGKNWGKGKGKG